METSKIQHSHYVHSDDIELKDRFLSSISNAEVSDLALKAYNLFKRAKGTLSNDELLFLLALKLLDGKDEYLILEVPTDFYINSLSSLDLSIYALILCFFDDEKSQKCISLAPQSAKLLFGISYPMIAKGLGKAKLLYDLQLWSLSPTVLFYTGQPNFKLPLRSKAHIITNESEEYSKNDTVIFCGNDEFINKIKEKIKNKC